MWHALQKLIPTTADTCKWHLALHLIGAATIIIVSARFLAFLARVAFMPSGVNVQLLTECTLLTHS